MRLFIITLAAFILLSFSQAIAERWPLGPGNVPQRVGNNYYTIQGNPGGYYLHNAIDVLGDPYEACYCIEDGYVVYRDDDPADPTQCGVFVNKTNGPDDGWCYWHFAWWTMPYNEGDAVSVDDRLGNLVPWPAYSFHHVHFNPHWFDPGTLDYTTTDNPLEYVEPDTDTQVPVFEEAESGQLFSFCEDNSPNRVDPDAVSGEVDIIARISDKIVDTEWKCIPYDIEWWIEGSSGSVPVTKFITFTGEKPSSSLIPTIYKVEGQWISYGSFGTERKFYFIVTNTDGDGYPEASDAGYYFDTSTLPDGDYTLYVKTSDYAGNTVTESMDFTIANGTGIDDGKPGIPQAYRLYNAVPNPSSGKAYISFALPKASEISLELYDVKGRRISTLAKGYHPPGEYSAEVKNLGRGVYVYELRAGEFNDIKKMVVR